MTFSGPDYELVYVTPKIAKQWLESNRRNRRVRNATVAKYKAAMENGHWELIPDAIAFDETGTLINGQHRLLAVIASGTTQPFFVARGLSTNAFIHTDAPTVRSLADHLDLMGMSHYNARAAVAKRLAFYAKKGSLNYAIVESGMSGAPGQPSYADINDRLDVATKYEPLSESIKFANNYKTSPLWTMTSIAFIHALYKPWHDGIDDFLYRTMTGLGLTFGDPAYVLRQRMERNAAKMKHERWTADVPYGYAIMAANADFQGRKLTKLQWNRDKFPQPMQQIASDICEILGWPAPREEADK